jgi:membrane-associated protein
MDIFSTENLIALIKAVGYLGVSGIVFAESGLLIGFFLPGDSLIFTAGFLASQGFLNIWILIPLLFLAAVLGDNVGYSFGYQLGPKIFTKEDSILLNKENLLYAKNFYDKHGPKTLILARFMPVIRTFAPILAGVGAMEYRKFFLYNMVGGAIWTVSLPLAGYYLGQAIPNVDRYLLPIILLIVFLSVLPSAVGFFKTKQHTRLLKKILEKRRKS